MLYIQALQWLKKLSQCLGVWERLACNKSDKIYKNVKIIYVVVDLLGFWTSLKPCDLDKNWCTGERNKTPHHWDSFFTLYYFDNILSVSAWITIRSSLKMINEVMWLCLHKSDTLNLLQSPSFLSITTMCPTPSA